MVEREREGEKESRAMDGEEEELILHPRPSAIVAALYTLRDLDVEVAVMHGPSGCSFKHSRLLEEDGMHVLTTAMNESNFVFGGYDSLVRVMRKAEEMFHPKLMGIVGTCASMIIGEDLNRAIEDSGVSCKVIAVNVHAGYRDNTTGVILTLESAYKAGIISIEEFERQKRVLEAATRLEKEVGAASRSYIPPSRGDSKIDVAKRLLELIRTGKEGVCVLNAKKETAFMFADIMRAVNRVALAASPSSVPMVNIANLDSNIGLRKIRGYSARIVDELAAEGITIDHIIGGLDEYAIAGERAAALIRSKYPTCDFVLLLGVPHAVPLSKYGIKPDAEVFSVTNGPRTVQPLKWLGHDHVVLEIDLHPKTMGATGIISSDFGDILQKLSR